MYVGENTNIQFHTLLPNILFYQNPSSTLNQSLTLKLLRTVPGEFICDVFIPFSVGIPLFPSVEYPLLVRSLLVLAGGVCFEDLGKGRVDGRREGLVDAGFDGGFSYSNPG